MVFDGDGTPWPVTTPTSSWSMSLLCHTGSIFYFSNLFHLRRASVSYLLSSELGSYYCINTTNQYNKSLHHHSINPPVDSLSDHQCRLRVVLKAGREQNDDGQTDIITKSNSLALSIYFLICHFALKVPGQHTWLIEHSYNLHFIVQIIISHIKYVTGRSFEVPFPNSNSDLTEVHDDWLNRCVKSYQLGVRILLPYRFNQKFTVCDICQNNEFTNCCDLEPKCVLLLTGGQCWWTSHMCPVSQYLQVTLNN